jgi:hypothetical protein
VSLLGRRSTPRVEGLDPALFEYLLDGDASKASADRKARGLPLLVLWRHAELAAMWKRHKAELLAEAKRRGIEAWAVRELDSWSPEEVA